MANALIYTRVSHDPKKQGRSVGEQEAECRATCEHNGWDVAEVVTENDRSASRHAKRTRPRWEHVKRRLASGELDVLVTWEASRSQRDLKAYAELRDLCAENSVLYNYGGTTFDLTRADDRFRTGLDALLGENEADKTQERILRAVRANAAKGRPHGRRLYGYRRVYDPDTGVLVGQEPEPAEADLIREAAKRVMGGEPAHVVAKDWNRRGMPTPARGGWDLTRVRRLLTNPHYTALRVHRGEIVGEADWAPIISRKDFNRLAVIFNDPSRARFRHGGDVKHLLSGIARCGICGARLYRGHDRGRGQYVCRDGDQHIARSQEHLDAYVTDIVVGILEREEITVEPTDDPEAGAARAEVDVLRGRLEDATTEFTAGNLTAATLGRIEADLMPQIEAADRRVRAAVTSQVVTDMTGANAAEMWDAASIEQRRQVVAELVDVVVKRSTRPRGRRGFDAKAVSVKPRSA